MLVRFCGSVLHLQRMRSVVRRVGADGTAEDTNIIMANGPEVRWPRCRAARR